MPRSAFFQRPVARVLAVAVAAGAALLPLAGLSSAAPPADAIQAAYATAATTAATATSTTLTMSPESRIPQGAPVTLIATISPTTATGTVQFRDGATDIGKPVTVTDSSASLTTSTSTLAVGSHQLIAVFTPADPAAYDPSTSPEVSLAVAPPPAAAPLPEAGSVTAPPLAESGPPQAITPQPETITPQPQQSGLSLDGPSVSNPAPADLDRAPGNTAPAPAGALGIPAVMLEAYQRAERTMAAAQPGCNLSYTLLAGIGKIESGHASNGRVDAAGNTLGPIRGQRLNGSPGIATISDTDQGALDGDAAWDRAVGPMQFIPSSWRRHGVGNPDNIYDSTLAAGRYLCAGGGNLSDPAQRQAAVFRYNHSTPYVTTVLRWAAAYQTGVFPTPSAPGLVPPVTSRDGSRSVTAAAAPRAPVVANLDAPVVADLDAAPATSATTAPPAQSLD